MIDNWPVYAAAALTLLSLGFTAGLWAGVLIQRRLCVRMCEIMMNYQSVVQRLASLNRDMVSRLAGTNDGTHQERTNDGKTT